ncbi:MAG: Transcription elongation factor GreA [Parcubacteria group bacterium GW2011_GWA2_40_8]|uniref:Transcription elongation factor GreA n=1 Tax=Candidatus Terrybacteria bacterium RIFCSPLOWO2_01_FULL_40_23 TaxID=1802366 RepID=A0A1G2PSV6_9BACT|nr:MAG: Transcription elongation factor GreA [Parcubacteria group bacterium GW2011_GWB1_40_14]KKR79123.1 MAG: Transcription elongation factor GreA [Parcubacteria group bacterium GW2011_GWA2_40_8]OHA51383.1 MAG: transcription elongation factor GreA [Candidatus Terrybacteria bacterium RIFCSPLOWO2_01_FULL_40_23]
MPANYITREGLGKLKNELEELKTTKRQEIAEKLQRSIAFGDLSENAEYQEAKEEQAFLEGRISELEDAVESAIIIDTNSNSHGVRVVSLGSKIVIEPTNPAGPKTTFIIVGSEEAAPSEGRISNASPIGMVLLGHKEGEMVSAKTPGGVRNYKILKIE